MVPAKDWVLGRNLSLIINDSGNKGRDGVCSAFRNLIRVSLSPEGLLKLWAMAGEMSIAARVARAVLAALVILIKKGGVVIQLT